jgi:DNA-binding MurR/RpiR family transcriptional regulator
MDAISLIRKNYRDFSKVNIKIADFILKNPADFLKMSASEIARATKTSPASITRFARSVGFDGLGALKLSAAYERGENKNDNIDPIISKDDSVEELCEKVAVLLKTAIGDLTRTLDKNQAKLAIELIKKARRIFIFGVGASSLTAYNLYHKFNRAGKTAIFNFDPHMNLEFVHYSTPDDAAIAVTYSGYTKEVLLTAEVAKRNKTPVVFITGNDGERIRELSDILLLAPDNERLARVGAISSVASSMAIGDMLYLGSIQEQLFADIPKQMLETHRLVNLLKERHTPNGNKKSDD